MRIYKFQQVMSCLPRDVSFLEDVVGVHDSKKPVLTSRTTSS